MTREKFILLSKTVQGIVLMLLPTLSTLLGWDWSEGDTSEVGHLVELGFELAGGVWALVGRLTAQHSLTVKPKTGGGAAALLVLLLVPWFLAGCGALRLPADASPREQAAALYLRYQLVQAAAETAVTSPLLADEPQIKDAIKAATQTATDAVIAVDAAARNCIRDPTTGALSAPPGKVCKPETVRLLLPGAKAGLATLSAELQRYGFLEAED